MIRVSAIADAPLRGSKSVGVNRIRVCAKTASDNEKISFELMRERRESINDDTHTNVYARTHARIRMDKALVRVVYANE